MDKNIKKSGLSYKDSGVNIAAGNQFVESIKSLTQSTHRPEVMGNIGGFGGLFSLANKSYKKPVLVSGTDGVGTKLKLAQSLHKHDTIGIDLVAMCVNDLVVTGAEPLFFLDYLATSRLNPETSVEVLKGISEGCKLANAALIGGETAEMPGMYQGEEYDLAGFSVGIVEEEKIINGKNITSGDLIIGLPSSGLHSNGYSLVRKILELTNTDLNQVFDNTTFGQTLLTPTKIYVKTILQLIKQAPIKGIAHITGGGLLENVPRVLPEYTQAVIHQDSWQWPNIFSWLQSSGNIETSEMYRTFNCGIGMVLIIDPSSLNLVHSCLHALNEPYIKLGNIQASEHCKAEVVLR